MLLAAIWTAIQFVTDAATLPENADKAWRFLVTSGPLLPWAILAIAILVLAWSLWPGSKDDEDYLATDHQTTHAPNSPIVGPFASVAMGPGAKAMSGDDNRKGFFNDAPNYGTQTFVEKKPPYVLTEQALTEVISRVNRGKPLRVIVASDQGMGQRLLNRLAAEGIFLPPDRCSFTYKLDMFPPLKSPLQLLNPDGDREQLLVLDPTI